MRVSEVVQFIEASRDRSMQGVNTTLIELYWQIGETHHEPFNKIIRLVGNSESLAAPECLCSGGHEHGKWEKKVALVTGSNRGIGLETARQLGQQGVTVIVAARSEQEAAQAAGKLRGEGIAAGVNRP